jgi:hypothetical protein
VLLQRFRDEAAQETLVADALQANATPEALGDASVQVDERIFFF